MAAGASAKRVANLILSELTPLVNAAVAAVTVAGIANAPARPGPRQSRSEVAKVLEKSGIADQMKAYFLWADWESGKRGRKN